MGMRHDGWAELVNDEEHGGCLIPMMMLYHEHDKDPEMRPKPISAEKREEVIVHMAAGLLGAYRYFRAQRQAYAGTTFTPEPGAPLPRSDGTIRARAAPGRSTSDAAAGRRELTSRTLPLLRAPPNTLSSFQ